MDSAAQVMGTAGGGLVIVYTVISVLRSIFSSSCVRGANGEVHLEIGLRITREEAAAAHADPDLIRELGEMLRERLRSRRGLPA